MGADITEHKSIRMKGYDYSAVGYYFITLVTDGRRELFGHIEHGKNILNAGGLMIDDCLKSLSAKFDGIEIINSVVMPNHVHFILFNNNSMFIPEIMRRFKAFTSHEYKKIMNEKAPVQFDFKLWQRSYYDVIIRNKRMLDFINSYINENPMRWHLDKLNGYCVGNGDEIYKRINLLR